MQIFQQLKGVVVVRFDQSVPDVAFRGVADRVHRLQAGVDGIAEPSHGHETVDCADFRLLRFRIQAGRRRAVDLLDPEKPIEIAVLQRDKRAFLDGDVMQRGGFRQMLFEDEAEFLLLVQLVHLAPQTLAQLRILNLFDQITDSRHDDILVRLNYVHNVPFPPRFRPARIRLMGRDEKPQNRIPRQCLFSCCPLPGCVRLCEAARFPSPCRQTPADKSGPSTQS